MSAKIIRKSSVCITLAKDGVSLATIVIAKKPTKVVQFAAYEFQFHVKEITGVILPIVKDDQEVKGIRILVGENDATRSLGFKNEDFKPQEYLIHFQPETLVLMGRDKEDYEKIKYDATDPAAFQTWPDFFDEQGTMYAVYDFLERFCGVRWFTPTEVGTDYPKAETLVVKGVDIRHAPTYRYRQILDPSGCVWYMYDRYEELNSLWYAGKWDNKAKEFTGESKGFRVYENSAYPELHKRYPNDREYVKAKRNILRLFFHRMRLGGDNFTCNHAFQNYFDRFWEKNPECPDLFVEKKVDWFAKGYGDNPTQPCYTNPEFIQQVIQDARDFFDGKGKTPEAYAAGDFFSISPMDNSDYCNCPRCRAFYNMVDKDAPISSVESFSDYIFHFANEVAREIKKSHPNKYISMLAYMQYWQYPKHIQPEPNIAVQLCINPRFPQLAEEQRRVQEMFDSWTKDKDRPIYLWLYYCFPTEWANYMGQGFWHVFPAFFAHTIGKVFKEYLKYGVRGAFFNGIGQDVETYISFKMLDDPTQDVDVLINDYFQRLYGPAGDPLKKLYLAIEETYCSPESYPEKARGTQDSHTAWEILGTEERMAEFAKLMDQARSAVAKGTGKEKKRVALFEKAVWNYMVEGRKKYFAHANTPIKKGIARRVPAAGGDPTKVDWSRVEADKEFYERDGSPADRKLEVRLAHDGESLYMQLEDMEDPKRLVLRGGVWSSDDWEFFVARNRSLPYRLLGLDFTGRHEVRAYGREGIDWGKGVKIVSDVTGKDRWTARLALPFASLVSEGAKPGETICMNLIRVTGNLASRQQITWNPHSATHQPDRFGELVLEE